MLSQHHSPVTPVTTLCAEAREAAQKLLNHYVKVGLNLQHEPGRHWRSERFLVQVNGFSPVYMHKCNTCHVPAYRLQVQGLIISQMLRKSVETRDWVNTIEPRNVRAVMKRVVEDTTSIDVQVTDCTMSPSSLCP